MTASTESITQHEKEVYILKACYARAYHRFLSTRTTLAVSDFGAHGYNKKNSNGLTIWDQCVARAKALKVSPSCLVSILFGCWTGREPPRPSYMLGTFIEKNVAIFDRTMREDVEILLNCDRQAYAVALSAANAENRRRKEPRSDYAVHVGVLAHDFLQISCLFRYCLARKLRAETVYKAVRDAADAQFLEYPPAYMDKWQNLLSKRHVNMGADYA